MRLVSGCSAPNISHADDHGECCIDVLDQGQGKVVEELQ